MKYYIIYDENYKIIGNTIQDTPPGGVFGYLEVEDITVSQTWYNYRLNAAHDGVELIPYEPPPPPTFEQLAAMYLLTVDGVLDTTARSFGYASMLTAVTYADEPADAVFQAEGRALRAWRSLTYRACYNLFAQAQAGAIPVPTEADVLAALPTAPVQADVRAAMAAVALA